MGGPRRSRVFAMLCVAYFVANTAGYVLLRTIDCTCVNDEMYVLYCDGNARMVCGVQNSDGRSDCLCRRPRSGQHEGLFRHPMSGWERFRGIGCQVECGSKRCKIKEINVDEVTTREGKDDVARKR